MPKTTSFMHKYLLAAVISLSFFSCDVRKSDKVVDDAAIRSKQALKDSTTVSVIDGVHDFGKVTSGEKVSFNFRFKNTGNKALVITDTHQSCGCTVAEKPEQPVLPGEIGFIKVVFDSKGKSGHQEKTITVNSNANPAFPALLLTGEVEEPKQ